LYSFPYLFRIKKLEKRKKEGEGGSENGRKIERGRERVILFEGNFI
jgi:hypothetical protein